MAKSELIGFVRKSNSGSALKLSISADAFGKAARYKGKDEKEYVSLVVSLDKVRDVMEGQKEATSIRQIVDG